MSDDTGLAIHTGIHLLQMYSHILHHKQILCAGIFSLVSKCSVANQCNCNCGRSAHLHHVDIGVNHHRCA